MMMTLVEKASAVPREVRALKANEMHVIGVMSDDYEPDHGAQRVVDLVAEDDEWEGRGARADEELEEDGVEEDDLKPLPPGQSRRTSRTHNERVESSPRVGGTQFQRKVTSSLGRRSRDNLSSDASRDSSPWDKRLCVTSSLAVEVLSSAPRTSTPGVQSSQSQNSDTASGTPGKPVPCRFLKQEFIPPRN